MNLDYWIWKYWRTSHQNIISHDFCNLNKLYIANRTLSKINHLKDIDPRISITDDNTEVAKNCEKIIISVKTPRFGKCFRPTKTTYN